MIDFIVENYLWFIIGGVVLLMALIGYIAEKTNFGRGNGEGTKEKTKKEKVKKDKNEEKEEVVNPVEAGSAALATGVASQIIDDNQNVENLDEEISISPETLLEQELNEGLAIEEDAFLSFPQVESENSNNEISALDNLEEDLTVPLNLDEYVDNDSEEKTEVEEIISEEPFIESPELEEVKIDNIDNQEIELPEIDEIKNKDEEDIWKF